jgi:hypothetical protein
MTVTPSVAPRRFPSLAGAVGGMSFPQVTPGEDRPVELSIHQGVAVETVSSRGPMGWLTEPSAGCSSLAC